MASIIPGFDYDIFISYRQKDNKGDKWVSEFVESLTTELESAFKENVSVYFDINPADGLLETHDVGETLKKKLKCLVFIPVISRTDCDPNSFAWEHEFKAFAELAATDNFGLKINLPNGNVISRILPVKIHELDPADLTLCESVLGGMLRSVDFVYKTSGVNRPLRSREEHPQDNINKTYYRDQINKVANSIRDIIQALSHPGQTAQPELHKKEKVADYKRTRTFFSKTVLTATIILLFLFVCLTGIYMYVRKHRISIAEKTITIIPLTNPPDDPELRTTAIGSMDAIITKLQGIKSLIVTSRLTSLQYLDSKKPVSELMGGHKPNYLVEISLSRTSNNLMMWVGLTETKSNHQMWADRYVWNEEQLMPIFTKVVQTIAGKLNINFTNQEIMNIEKDLTKNPEAYLNYLTASAGLISAMGNKFLDSTSFRSAIDFYDKAIEKDPDFANAYARRAIALSWGIHTGELPASNKEKCLADITRAATINSDLSEVDIAWGFYYYYITSDYPKALISFNLASEKDPESYLPLFYMAMVYRAMSNWDEVRKLLSKVIKFDLQDPLVLTNIGLCYQYLHKYDSALIYHQKAIDVDKDWGASYQNKFGTLLLKYDNTTEAHNFLNQVNANSSDQHLENNIILDMYDGKYFEAFNKAKKSKPEDFTYGYQRYMYLGNLSLLLHDKPGAEQYFSNAIDELNHMLQSDTSNASLIALKGVALAGKGNQEAIREGERAVAIARKQNNKILESEINLFLAEILTKLGMLKEAVKYIESVLAGPSLFSTNALKTDPIWKPLLSNPEIKTLIAKYDSE
jgi:tetratricopeptide (TPR) repeat protein